MADTEKTYYCRLYCNDAIDNKCYTQCESCKKASPDDLLTKNFILSGSEVNK